VLIEKLAMGGMASVHLARESADAKRLVALKQILPHLVEDSSFLAMFLDEARIAARLHHPNVVEIYDLGIEGEALFIAMEFVHGEDLRRIEKRCLELSRPMPMVLACRAIREACRGLDYAHKRTDAQGKPLRIVHRDVSPQNMLVSFEGAVKVTDFGVAKAADKAHVTASGIIKGKHPYMSPEQALGQEDLDHRTDVFALGVVLYEAVTSVRLFRRATDLQTLKAVAECEVMVPSKVSPGLPMELDDILMQALERDRDRRFASAGDLGDALERFVVKDPAGSVQRLGRFVCELFADRLQREAREKKLHPAFGTLFGAAGAGGPPTPALTDFDKAKTIELSFAEAPAPALRASVETKESAPKRGEASAQHDDEVTQRPDPTLQYGHPAPSGATLQYGRPPVATVTTAADTPTLSPEDSATVGMRPAFSNLPTIIATQQPKPPSRWPRAVAAVLLLLVGAAAWYFISQMKPIEVAPVVPVAVEQPKPVEPAPKPAPAEPLTTTACTAPLEVTNAGGKLWVTAALATGTALKLFGEQDAPFGVAMVVETSQGKARLIADEADKLPERLLACPKEEAAVSGQVVMKGAGSAGITNTSSGAWTDCDLLLPNNTLARLPRGTVLKPGKQQWLNALHFSPRKAGSEQLKLSRATLRCEEGEFELELSTQ